MAMRARSVPFEAHSSFAFIAAAFTSSEAGCHDGGSCRHGAPVNTYTSDPAHAQVTHVSYRFLTITAPMHAGLQRAGMVNAVAGDTAPSG